MYNADESRIVNTFGVGRSFGEAGLIKHQFRSLTVRCIEETGLIYIKAEDFLTILEPEVNH